MADLDLTVTCPKCYASVDVPIEADVMEFVCEHCGERSPILGAESFGQAMKDPLLGEVIAEWEIQEKVGEGGFGSVYRAFDRNLQRPVAMKVMLQSLTSNLEFVQKFIREAITAAQLNHPNIVGIHRVGRDEQRNLHFLVMEFLEGETLADLIDRRGALPLDEAVGFILQCADALAVAQDKNIIHRDIKPENIMIDKTGNVKITDFGLAKTLTTDMKSTKVMGTPHYMSPEQFEGKAVDGRTDIYSLGVTFYHMLTEAKPYAGTNTVQIIYSILTQEPRPVTDLKPDVPEQIWKIIRKMIAKDMADRYANFRDVSRDLQAFLDGSAADTVRCPSCAATNVTGRKFCGKCGTSLVVVCPKCGSEEPAGSRHCGQCGADIEGLQKVKVRLGEATKIRDAGDLRRALEVYREILEVDPGNAEVEQAASEVRSQLDRIEDRKLEVETLLKGGKAEEALAALKLLLEEFPSSEDVVTYGRTVKKALLGRIVDAHLMVADKAIEEQRHADAVTAFGKALEVDPERSDVATRLADLEKRMAAADESLITARKALAAGRHALALNKAREVLQFRPGHEEAGRIQAEAMDGVESIESFVNEARSLLESKDYEEAIVRLETALEISPADEAVIALVERAKEGQAALKSRIAGVRKLIAEQKLEEAVAAAGEILREKPDIPTLVAMKDQAETLIAERKKHEESARLLADAEAAAKRGDLESALAACTRVLEVDPGHEVAARRRDELETLREETATLREQAEDHAQKCEFEKAVVVFARLKEMLPGSEEIAKRLEDNRQVLERLDGALAKAREQVAAKDFDGAIASAGEALALSPDHAGARELRQEAERGKSVIAKHLKEAENYIGSEMFDDASQELTKALDLGATEGSVAELKRIADDGKVQRLKSEATRSFTYKDYEEAEEKYQEILALKSDDADARKGIKLTERARRRREREGILPKAGVAALLVMGLFLVQFRAIRAGRDEEARAEPAKDVAVVVSTAEQELAALQGFETDTLSSSGAPTPEDWRSIVAKYDEYSGSELAAGEQAQVFREGREFAALMLEAARLPDGSTDRLTAFRNVRSFLQNSIAVDAATRNRRLSLVRDEISGIESVLMRNIQASLDSAVAAEQAGDWSAAKSTYEGLTNEDASIEKQCREGEKFAEVMLTAGRGEPRDRIANYRDARQFVGSNPDDQRRREDFLNEQIKVAVKDWVAQVQAAEGEDWALAAEAYGEIASEEEALSGLPELQDELVALRQFATAMGVAQGEQKAGKYAEAFKSYRFASGKTTDPARRDVAMQARESVQNEWVGVVKELAGKAKGKGEAAAGDFYRDVITELALMRRALELSPEKLVELVTSD